MSDYSTSAIEELFNENSLVVIETKLDIINYFLNNLYMLRCKPQKIVYGVVDKEIKNKLNLHVDLGEYLFIIFQGFEMIKSIKAFTEHANAKFDSDIKCSDSVINAKTDIMFLQENGII